VAPQRYVIAREGNTGIEADAADDQVIADQYRILHRAAGNHAGLNKRAFDDEKGQNYPNPGDDLVLNLLGRIRTLRFFILLVGAFGHFSFHDGPPLPIELIRWDIRRYSKTCKTYLRCLQRPFAAIPETDSPGNRRPKIRGSFRHSDWRLS